MPIPHPKTYSSGPSHSIRLASCSRAASGTRANSDRMYCIEAKYCVTHAAKIRTATTFTVAIARDVEVVADDLMMATGPVVDAMTFGSWGMKNMISPHRAITAVVISATRSSRRDLRSWSGPSIPASGRLRSHHPISDTAEAARSTTRTLSSNPTPRLLVPNDAAEPLRTRSVIRATTAQPSGKSVASTLATTPSSTIRAPRSRSSRYSADAYSNTFPRSDRSTGVPHSGHCIALDKPRRLYPHERHGLSVPIIPEGGSLGAPTGAGAGEAASIHRVYRREVGPGPSAATPSRASAAMTRSRRR